MVLVRLKLDQEVTGLLAELANRFLLQSELFVKGIFIVWLECFIGVLRSFLRKFVPLPDLLVDVVVFLVGIAKVADWWHLFKQVPGLQLMLCCESPGPEVGRDLDSVEDLKHAVLGESLAAAIEFVSLVRRWSGFVSLPPTTPDAWLEL